MYSLANDDSKTIVLLINDYNPEFGVATEKLEKILGRNLTGIVLVDKNIKQKHLNKPIANNKFIEIVCDYNNPASITTALRPFIDKLLVVNASSERNQPYYSKLIPHIPYINTPTETSIVWATHKDQMRRQFSAYCPELTPRSIRIEKEVSDDSIKDIVKELTFPLITKPAGLALSILVRKAGNIDELLKNIKESRAVIEDIYKKNRGRGEPNILIEEFISGQMFSVDAYVNDKGDTFNLPPVKVTIAASIGFEGYYSYQTDSDHGLGDEDLSEIHKVTTATIHAVGLRSSAAHIEIFKTASGWQIVELGPRAGGFRQNLYALAYGIDHALNELLIKINLPVDIPRHATQYSSAIMIYPENEGKIISINGFDQIQKMKNVFASTLYAKVGDHAAFCGNGGNVSADFIFFSKDKKEIDIIAKKIRETLIIKTAH